METLEDTIAALFKRAASEPSAEGTDRHGLHLKARIVEGQRQLLLSRPDVKPSDVEVSTCAESGAFSSYEVTGGPRWQLITELGTRDHCTHAWGFTTMGDAQREHFYSSVCTSCAASWSRLVPKRASVPETFRYNGEPVTHTQLKAWSVRGPKGPVYEDKGNRVQPELVQNAVLKQASQRPGPTPIITGQVCGTCGNGTPTEYPNEVECQLGWAKHDGALRPILGGKFEWIPIPVGHGVLALPLLHPAHSCAAVLGGRRPGWAARA